MYIIYIYTYLSISISISMCILIDIYIYNVYRHEHGFMTIHQDGYTTQVADFNHGANIGPSVWGRTAPKTLQTLARYYLNEDE